MYIIKMTELEQLQTLRNLYTKTLHYHEEIMQILCKIGDDKYKQLTVDFSHDMKTYFDLREVHYNIRNARDRIYHIETLETELISNLEANKECNHTMVTDFIDVDIDKSKKIEYCSKCNYTPP